MTTIMDHSLEVCFDQGFLGHNLIHCNQVQLAPITPCTHEQFSFELAHFVLTDVSSHALLHWEILHSEDQSLKLRRSFY